jgi:Rrf2 family protein
MKARYAIRALTALARHSSEGSLTTSDIAQAENIPARFLGAIMLDLRQHGFVISRRGRGGGYSLRQSADEITVAAVLTVIDGPLASVPCVGPTIRHSCNDCPSVRTCGPRLVLDRVDAATRAALERTTIGELATRTASRSDLEAPIEPVI